MPLAIPKILVVADPGEQHELVALLRGSGAPFTEAVIASGDGDDGTLHQFEELRPQVVVIAATITDGDTRALVGAMRDAAPAGLFVVLLGDERGPVRNALDALDFGCDRFVARPIAAKALRFAVLSGLGIAGGAGTQAGASRPAMISAAQLAESAAARVTEPMPVAVRITEEIPAVWGAGVPAPSLAEQRARWAAMADALGDGDGDEDDDVIDDLVRHRRGEIEIGVERTIHAEPPPPARVTVSSRFASVEEPDAIELTDSELDDLSVDEPADASDDLGPDLSYDLPAAPVREPTLVISDDVTLRPPSPPPPPPAEVVLVERHEPSGSGDGWSSSSQVSASDDDDDVLADVAAGMDEDLSIDLRPSPPAAPAAPSPPAEPPPSGGDFARELRRKMSAMAERLFRGGDLPAAPVAIGPGHDHHTEIDLRGLVDDPLFGRGGGTEVFEIGGGETFVGAEEPEHLTNPQGTESRGTAEAGEIQRGVSDAAALIARMFAADFTGRIVFRRATVEKVIHIESGRPVFASSSLAHDRMGELLLREGKITAEQYARCRDLVRDTGRRMGEILVERGFLKRRELLPAVRRHVEDIIYSLFAWDHGEYRIVAGDGAASERIRLSRHPAAMVLEGVRRKLDRATLERLVGPPTAVVETTDRDKLAAITGVADLSAEERAALGAFDGTADLAHVARTSGAGLANVYQLAWGLHLLGLATTRRRAGDDEGDAPALVGESDLVIDRDRVRARHALVMDADYFALLGVRRDATGFEIKRAYEAARRDFAADTFPVELRRELQTELDDIAHVLDEAYRVLRDDALRGKYVAHLRDFDEVAS